MKFRQWLLAAAAASAFSAPAGAASVTTTLEFTRFTLGGFAWQTGGAWDPARVYQSGLSVNGTDIDVCSGDPTCAATFADPTRISTPISGNSVSFGYRAADIVQTPLLGNIFSFSAATSTVDGVGAANPFKLGSITYMNGGMYPLMFLDFVLTTHSTDARFDDHRFIGRVRLDTNISQLGYFPDPASPEWASYVLDGADYFSVQDAGGQALASLGSVRVYDWGVCPAGDPQDPACNTGSVDLIGHIGSLDLDGFANPSGGAFLNASTGPVLAASVPEPSAVALALLALSAAGAARRQRTVAA